MGVTHFQGPITGSSGFLVQSFLSESRLTQLSTLASATWRSMSSFDVYLGMNCLRWCLGAYELPKLLANCPVAWPRPMLVSPARISGNIQYGSSNLKATV